MILLILNNQQYLITQHVKQQNQFFSYFLKSLLLLLNKFNPYKFLL